MKLLLAIVMISFTKALHSSLLKGRAQRTTFGKIVKGNLRLPSRLFSSYSHLDVEQKWQKYWDDHDVFIANRRPGHKKKYVLDMFPYPSGSGLHVGHPEGYTATDIMSRYWRMNDYDVLHPHGVGLFWIAGRAACH